MNSIEENRAVRPVLLTIRSEQLFEGQEPDSIELMTEGTMETTEEGFRLSYQETELTGMEGTTTAFEIKGSQVILTRSGTVSSQMVFEEGRRHLSMYETPYGELSIGVNTKRMRSTLGEAGGDLEIDYAIEIDNLVAGHNLFRMNVKKHPARPQRGRTEKRRADYAESDPGRP